jgi:pimeloyl-ACP methyl ester carboxylesterase
MQSRIMMLTPIGGQFVVCCMRFATLQPPAKSVKASEHVADLRAMMDAVLPGRKPLLVAHSFGGMLVMLVSLSFNAVSGVHSMSTRFMFNATVLVSEPLR